MTATTVRFSAYWTDALGNAIKEACTEPFTMQLVGQERRAVINAINQGIDSYLEACYVPDRGDKYINGPKLDCTISPESLPVLVRRLMETSNEVSESLASGICQTLGIELV